MFGLLATPVAILFQLDFFFFETAFLAFGGLVVVEETMTFFERRDFFLSARALGIKPFFAALSRLLKALLKFSFDGLVVASLIAFLSALIFVLLLRVRTLSWRIFLIADLIKGICNSLPYTVN